MLINALSHFGLTDIVEISKMGIDEYFLRLEAYQIGKIDEQENIALQAWLNQTVQATKGSSTHPKPVYSRFNDFYNSVAYKNDVHRSYDPNYVPVVESEQESQQKEQDEIFKRYREREKQKQEQKQKGQPN